MENMTVEQLVAYGLSQEEAEAIVAANGSGAGNSLPFPVMKISHDPDIAPLGNFAYGIEKGEDGEIVSATDLGKAIEMQICGSKGQYSKYDGATQQITVSSNLFDVANAKSAVDKKSGIPIAKLKATDDKIKFNEIMVARVRPAGSDEDFVTVIFYAKGAWLYDFNNGLRKKNNVGTVYTLSNKKKKNGSVVYFVPEEGKCSARELSDTEIIGNLKEVAAATKEFNKWVEGANASAAQTPTAQKQDDVEPDDDEDISFE